MKLYLTLISLLIFVKQQSPIQQYQEDILGKWIPEGENIENRWEFTQDGMCFKYSKEVIYASYQYRITKNPSKCGIIHDGASFSYLELSDTISQRILCYEIDILNNKKMSLIYLSGSGFKPQLFSRWND